MTVGRSGSNDLVLADPSVSRTHAAITVNDGAVYIKDLGSTVGTTVNGKPLIGSKRLRSGDVLAFAGARYEFEGADGATEATTALPVTRDTGPPGIERTQGQYDIGTQHGGSISNVAGNQYMSYVNQITRERESFLRDIAATKTKARWLCWIGLAATIVGIVLFSGSIMQYMAWIIDMLRREPVPGQIPQLPEDVMGPTLFIGFGLYLAGNILLIIGIVLHVVATSRRKRVDRELPMPRPPAF
ncbi:adenylate cyclase [Arthrobacter crystallopoietes BAB-32]|uniref:Adenylate cyclase n=2 Tax=Crystallibacter crystallopoietes TaxID=37928 RepID=N1V3F6_9MICC|nr:adenylate cyclase [Arthrobacter crystallopoietes BAB-32]